MCRETRKSYCLNLIVLCCLALSTGIVLAVAADDHITTLRKAPPGGKRQGTAYAAAD